MRLPARRIATSALCATLLLGVTGPVAMAADGDSDRERTRAASRAPLPGADELNAQIQALSGLGGVVTPVTRLLGAVLKADDGRLTAQQAEQLGNAVDAAIDEAVAKVEATGTPTRTDAATPGTTTPGTTTPGTAVPGVNTPAQPPAVAQPPVVAQPPAVARPNGDAPVTTLPAPFAPAAPAQAAQAQADSGGLIGTALDALRQAIDALLGASTTGRPEQVTPAAADVVTDVVNVAAATLVDGGLPAPDLAGLPPLPAAPNAPAPANALPNAPANAPADPS
ncbi:hypothetical protein [Streptomyces sp. NPDC006134]|uniref:hypothetical protein n=1 Tax=Streptomyces sp. NPDC006134 TaxID=3154467 RepID=UPI0033DD441E